jgi:hypothetical protein
MGHCPCHHDRNPSFSIGRGRNGQTIVHCFAGCPEDELLAHFRRLGYSLDPDPPTPGEANLEEITRGAGSGQAPAEGGQSDGGWRERVVGISAVRASDP